MRHKIDIHNKLPIKMLRLNHTNPPAEGDGIRYAVYQGGSRVGDRVNTLYRENIGEPQILDALDTLFARWAGERRRGERFGDFVIRTGVVAAGRPHG